MSCSYCGCQGHNIRLCNDSSITRHYNNLKGIYIVIKQSSVDILINKNRFNNSCLTYSVTMLKAVVAKFVGGSISLSKKELINRIWYYFFVIITDTVLQNELRNEWIERAPLPNIPDVIPAYAQDLAISNGSIVTEFGPLPVFEIVDQRLDQRSDQRSDQRVGQRVRQMFSSGTMVFELLRNARARALENNRSVPHIREVMTYMQDYIAFDVRNLDEEFERAEFDICKKYNISMCVSVTETKEELEKCEDCSICFEETKLLDTITINCGHKFCGTCITNTLKMYNNMAANPACACCRSQMTSFTVKNQEIYSSVSNFCIM